MTLSQWYVKDVDGSSRFFSDIRKANEFAQQVADVTKRTAVRYDIHGGQSWFYPKVWTEEAPCK